MHPPHPSVSSPLFLAFWLYLTVGSFLDEAAGGGGLSLIALLGLVSFAWISVLDHHCQKECLCALLCRCSCLQACVAWGQNVNLMSVVQFCLWLRVLLMPRRQRLQRPHLLKLWKSIVCRVCRLVHRVFGRMLSSVLKLCVKTGLQIIRPQHMCCHLGGLLGPRVGWCQLITLHPLL